MSVRPDTDPATQAVAPKPVAERPMGRRTLLRAMIITVPVVAAFSRNAWAASAGCPQGCKKCAACDSGCVQKTSACNNGQCKGHGFCAAVTPLRGSNLNDRTGLASPFNANSSSITDGGFNSSPWQ